MKKYRNSGFTLIELLIVIAIIGVLAGLVTVNLQDARERARDAQRKADLRSIRNAMELFKNDRKPPAYPVDLTELVDGGYMANAPTDPLFRQSAEAWVDYTYTQVDSLHYTLMACLENGSDVDKDGTNTCVSGVSYTLSEP